MNRTAKTSSYYAGRDIPIITQTKRKKIIIEDANQYIMLGKLSTKIKYFVREDIKIENINTFFSHITKTHITVIFYYE